MRIKEACIRTRLTKKAIAYYEQHELIHPAIDANGYRDYSLDDIVILREIAVLRALGIGVKDIVAIQLGKNKEAILAKCKQEKKQQMEQEQMRHQWLVQLSDDYNIEKMFDDIMMATEYDSIQEKLVQAFPGTFGMYLSWHFGSFLTQPIATAVQKQAFDSILEWLDHLPDFQVPEELQGLMEGNLEVMQQGRVAVTESVADIDAYMKDNKEQIDWYVAYIASEEYKNSPIYKLKMLIVDFQKQNGYVDVFLANMRLLSPAYDIYMTSLEEANQRMLEAYPDVKHCYET